MYSELEADISGIDLELEKVRNTAMNISAGVSALYTSVSMDVFEEMITDIIKDNDTILGSGIWFEPNVYNKSEKYVGPYWYKNGSDITLTYDYSNAQYNYFEQEYYLNAKNSSGTAVITDPYYDATSNIIMASCSAPIYDKNGKFIGAVTVDISLTTIENMVESIHIKDGDLPILTTSDGYYINCDDKNKVINSQNILNENNSGFVRALKDEVFSRKSGYINFSENNKKYTLYFGEISQVGWKLMIKIPDKELNRELNDLLVKMIVIGVFVILVCSIVVLIQLRSVSANLNKVKKFAVSLADGDFSIDLLEKKSDDELGEMSKSLNDMFESNKEVISDISSEALKISNSSAQLNTSASELLKEFKNIEAYMKNVNESTLSSSASTEEVNASVEEVNASVNVLVNQTVKNSAQAKTIREQAQQIEHNSQKAYDNASIICSQREKEIEEANNKAEVVENIGKMADVISNIAEQINLLSLNASIEAARAGEQGKGFAVVAAEIGSLADETSGAVKEIQTTIHEVQKAFESLVNGANDLLGFLRDTVTPDYKSFVDVGRQYGNAADTFEEFSYKIKNMSEEIEKIMSEVSLAIQAIAESAQDTANSSSNIMNAVNNVSGVVESISDMSASQKDISNELNAIVNKFKLK